MAIINSEKIKIMWKLTTDSFAEANTENFANSVYPRKLGSSVSAVNAILANGDELKSLMPTILGLDPKSISSNWDKMVRNYWDSLSLDIYSSGKELEIGFIYDVTDTHKKTAIKDLKLNAKTDATDEELMKHLQGSVKGKPNVPDNELYKYATPISPLDWLIYRYCEGVDGKGYRDIANRDSDVENIQSPFVRFYFFDETKADKLKKQAYKLRKDAMVKYIEVISKHESVEDILIVMDKDISKLDDTDKDMLLDVVVKEQPKRFLEVVDDDNLQLKARIERYISAGIIRRVPGTSMIVDGNDPSVIIGNTTNEAVTFFSPENTATKAAVAEYSNLFNASKSKK